MHPLWYRNSATYQIDPACFLDSDGDGGGDLRGVMQRLEHVRGLGATSVWLLPFYESPYRDHGYDVTNHLAVDPRFGDLADIAGLLDHADALGLRVIIDLVCQHTSVDHPWFQEARHDRRSPYRDYYVWADEPVETDVEPVFPTQEDGVWEWDEEAQQFYRHCFYSHEPDLELGNPRVRDEMFRIMGFWLRLGIAGFRVDAVPYMIERARNADSRDRGLWLLEDMRRFVSLRRPEAILVGEVDVPAEEYADYLGDDSRFTMLLDFWKNNHIFLALAEEDAEPLVRALKEQPAPPGLGQYANFLRNHDELDLEQLTEDEREVVMEKFAPDPDMRIYGRGIRRRLAPMLGDDVDRIVMAHALLVSLPGSPVLTYGDEVGLGDDLSRVERDAVRTSMPWAEVYAQMSRPNSLLARVGRLVRARLGAVAIGSGTSRVIETGCPSVLCLRHDHDDSLVTAVNLAGRPVVCELGDEEVAGFVEILADDDYDEVTAEDPKRFHLNAYGYRWFRKADDPPAAE